MSRGRDRRRVLRPLRPFLVLSVGLGALGAACGGEAAIEPALVRSTVTLDPDQQRFCDALAQAFAPRPEADPDSSPDSSPDPGPDPEQAFFAALDLAPDDLRETAAILSEQPTGVPTATQLDALHRFNLWVDSRCVAAASFSVRIGPIDPPAGFITCGNSGWMAGMSDNAPVGWAAVYGDASSDDPWNERLVAVLTGLRVDPGDGPAGQATVQGQPAVTGAPGLFQQVSSPELGQTVTWELGGQELTVLGRGYAETEIADLLVLAETVRIDDGGRAVLADPPLDLLYQGDRAAQVGLSPYLLVDPVYTLTYHQREGNGIIQISGLELTADALDASRAFLAHSERHEVKGRPGFVGAAWGEDLGPYVAAWQESDGVVVWVTGLGPGIDRQSVVDVAASTTSLTDDQWSMASSRSPGCGPDNP